MPSNPISLLPPSGAETSADTGQVPIQAAMEGGYLLAHVLEAVVPGHDLGESPSCDVVLNSSVVQCPIPSTLRSENVALPLDRGRASQLGDMNEPVVHVRAFDSRRRGVGIVVVPVTTLVPLEVWNVWYAMDEGEDDEAEEIPAEETPKMHLLLQHVPADAAAVETPQQREMRAQDFLLRALQQLNASLEAKVMVHQQGRAQPPLPQMPSVPQQLPFGAGGQPCACGSVGGGCSNGTLSLGGYPHTRAHPPSLDEGAAQAPHGRSPMPQSGAATPVSPSAQAAGASMTPMAAAPPFAAAPSTPTACGTCGGGGGGHGGGCCGQSPTQQQANSQTPPPLAGTTPLSGQSPLAAQQPGKAAMGGGSAALGLSNSVPNLDRGSTSAMLAPAGKDEVTNSRMQSYDRIIAALEEKQRFYDDQEARLASLTRSLDEQHSTSRALNQKMREASAKHQSALEAEMENTRQAHSGRAALEEKVAELQQEVALRKAHEDSLQRRVALMESELSVVHQKCVIVDSVEEEAQNLRREVDRYKEAKASLHQQLADSDRQLAAHREELATLREAHQRELEQAGTRLSDARREQEVLRQSLHSCQDAARDADVKKRLLNERIEDLHRQVATLEGEVSNNKAMLDREKEHRQELERKLEEQELRRLDAALDEHRQIIESLREQSSAARRDAQEEQSKAASMATELASVRRELAQSHRQQAESRSILAQAEDVRMELQTSRERCEELRSQLKAMQQDSHKVAENHQVEIAEHSKAQQVLCKERNEKQQEIGSLRVELARAQRQVEELSSAKDQMATALATAQEASNRSDELERQVQRGHEEIREYHARRDEVHRDLERFTAKFRDDALTQDQRVVELESALEDRNNEIKLLMYRVQELSSKYTACKGDTVDMVLAKWVNGYRPAVPFFRLAQGLYLFGRRQVICKISNDKPVFRVGGGFIGFDKFLELYASEELERLLNYDMDDRTGDPKFLEAQRLQKAMDDSGYLAELRARAELTVQTQHRPGK